MTDYNAGDSLTEAVTACQTALATLQRLGRSDLADGPLTDAESANNYGTLDNDTEHNDAWKLQRYAQTYTNVVTSLARKLTSAANSAGKQDTDDASNVFGVTGLSGDVASLAIARRDADERIEGVTDPAQRQALLAQATRNGDPTLARAIVQAAFEFNDVDTVNAFIAAYPNLNDAVERLWTAQNRKTVGVDLAVGFRLAALKPRAIGSMMDYEIALIASGQTSAGSWNV
jgi:hypothetical protein